MTIGPLQFLIIAWPLRAASRSAADTDIFTLFMVAVCGAVAAGVVLLIVVFCVRYRRRSADQIAEANISSRILEIGWTVIPFLIFLGMFYWGVVLYMNILQPPSDAVQVNVIAKQWMWKFQHASGQREINSLHVPVGTPIKLIVSSQDVIHSFFVPAFRLHFDVLPGRFRTTWFEATETGTFDLMCSQYCGTQHSKMRGQIVVMTPEEYQKWLASVPEGSLASDGEKLFRQLSCNSCHTGGHDARGPQLQGLLGSKVYLQDGGTAVVDENYIRESVVDPQAKIVAGYRPIMPTFKGQIDEEQMIALIAYIRSLDGSRQQLPILSDPEGPQPTPVQDAIRQSRTSPANAEGTPK